MEQVLEVVVPQMTTGGWLQRGAISNLLLWLNNQFITLNKHIHDLVLKLFHMFIALDFIHVGFYFYCLESRVTSDYLCNFF